MAWNALVLGGGGAKGEFEVGILEHLAQKQFNFDFFTGVSVGALNVSVLAQYASLAEAVPALENLWQEIQSNDDVYTQSRPTRSGRSAPPSPHRRRIRSLPAAGSSPSRPP